MKHENTIVQARHAAYDTPPVVILDIVREAMGCAAQGVEKIARGYDNEVYRVPTGAGEAAIVRIRRHGEVSFSQEAWAIAQSKAAGAPVADVLLLTTRTFEDGPPEVMVQRALPGRPASDIWPSLSPFEQARVCAQAGAALRRIHSVPVGGFYRRHEDGSWDFPDWDAIAASARRDRAAEAPALRRAGLNDAEISRLLAVLDASLADFSQTAPVLCHADFKPAHWFFDDSLTLTGVIDFGDFQGGPALLDLARLSLYAPDVNLADVLTGYDEPDGEREEWEKRLKRFMVGQALGYAAHVTQQGDTAGAAYFVERLRGLLTAMENG